LSAETRNVFETPWFKVIAEPQAGGDPYYMLELQDYVAVVAMTDSRTVLFVKQFRPVVRRETIELPSGHVEVNETPENAARRELFEETGFGAVRLDLLGTLVPDVGRLTNRMWCYFADHVTPADEPHEREEGVSVLALTEDEAFKHVADGTIDHALNLAVLMLAVTRGKISLR
jgi:8-oxo-dGTP pyrophosphatase MutT (NUDIX family)